MAKICYIFGKTVSARQKLLLKMMGSSNGPDFLHIVPTKGRVMELETDSLFWIRHKVNTLTGVIHRIFEEDIRPDKYADHFAIDQILGEMLIRKAITEQAGEYPGLGYFNSLFNTNQKDKDFPGVCRNILSFISTLYCNNYEDIYANDLGGRILWQEWQKPGSSDQKYALEEDLLWLMGDYEELKREIRGYDNDDILKNVKDFLRVNRQPSYTAGIKIIILDSLAHISRIEEDILFYLINMFDELWWPVDCESKSDDPVTEFRKSCGSEGERGRGIPPVQGEIESCRAYYSLVSLMDRLRESGIPERVIWADEVSYPNPYAGLMYVNRDNNIDTECNSLKIGAFASEVDEVRAIASKIKRLLCKPGQTGRVSPGDIRVIFPDLTCYASLVSEIFTEYGLPFSLTKGIPLSSHPLSNIFLKIIQLPIGGFRRADIFSLFSSGIIKPDFLVFDLHDFSYNIFSGDILLPGDSPETITCLFNTEPPHNILKGPDIHLFDTAMRRCGIDRLGQRLENISNEKIPVLRGRYLEAISETRNTDEKNSLRYEYYLFIYQRLVFQAILEPFISILDCSTPEKIVERYRDIIRLLGFPANIIDSSRRDTGFEPDIKRGLLKRDIRAFTLLNELLNTSQREIKLAQRLFRIEKSDMMLASFLKTFRDRINSKYLLDERNPDVIRVSQWLETRGRSFDYVFAGGLISGRFPLSEPPDFIIPEASRGIFRIIDPVDQSKQLFSNILKNYEKGLFLSYPQNISDKPVQPSQVIQDLYTLINRGDEKTPAGDKILWEPEIYHTSESDLLNTNIAKNAASDNIALAALKNIIIRDSSRTEDIIRGIKSINSRSAENGLFEYDGAVVKASGFFDFAGKKARTFSSTSLETLANCPMKYLFRYIYNMKDPDEITADETSRDIGRFTHDILSMLFKKLAGLNTNIRNMGIDRAFNMARHIIEDFINNNPSLEHLDFVDFYKQELFSGLDPENIKDSRQGVIASLLCYENEEFISRVPEGVEYEFGKSEKQVRLGDVFVKGYIDRFDRDMNSPDTVYIYDYKTGYIKSSSTIKKGLAFQLPVYIRAIQSMDNSARISASFYSLKRSSFLERDVIKQQANCNAPFGGLDITGVTVIDEFVTRLTRLIEKGLFHHSADGLVCDYCTYKYACHKDERRMGFLVENCPDLYIYSGERNSRRWQEVDDFRKEWKAIRQSMEKAEVLKTPSARKRHIETVLEYKNDLIRRKDSLPFIEEYMDSLIDELDRFLCRNNPPGA